eukprot:203640-Amphidinium_carterae.1
MPHTKPPTESNKSIEEACTALKAALMHATRRKSHDYGQKPTTPQRPLKHKQRDVLPNHRGLSLSGSPNRFAKGSQSGLFWASSCNSQDLERATSTIECFVVGIEP